MPVVTKWYAGGPKAMDDSVDWASDTIKEALCASSYTPNQGTHDFFNDITDEISGPGYTAGGVTLTGKSVSVDTATRETRYLAGNAVWGSSGSPVTFIVRYAIIYKDTGNAATSPLLGYIDFGAEVSTGTGGILTIQHDATSGVLKITAS